MLEQSSNKLREVLQADSLTAVLAPSTPTNLPKYASPSGSVLEQVIDSYNWSVVQKMAEARGITSRKKNQTVRDLARVFYDARNIIGTVSNLSPVALSALAYLARRNGIVNVDVLNS